ncbi:MAG: hypothetical protein IH973_15240, partial [Myxococcales bacterium]|nr:hypothetical protein [Myxococcales bacterium]
MALIDRVRSDVGELAAAGWGELFQRLGLDVESDDPAAALRQVVTVDRDIPGLGDFATDDAAFVEPGDPTRSLLYHLFASPNVRVE